MKTAFASGAIKEILFPQYPDHDCIWDVCRAADDKVYFSLCSEGRAATALLMRYDPGTGKIDELLDVGRLTGDGMKPGKIPQSKIHTTMCPTSDGLLYFTTHCTAPPPGEEYLENVGTLGSAEWGYTGSFVAVYNTHTHESRCVGLFAPNEGIRIMRMDQRWQVLYGITYPKHHLRVFDLKTGQSRDLGRIGNLGSFGMFMDKKGRPYGTDDAGWMWRYDPQLDDIQSLNVRLPHLSWRESPYNFLWYAVEGPDGAIYGTTYYDGRLFRYDPEVGGDGLIEDLDRDDIAAQQDQTIWSAPYIQAPVFDSEGRLWYGSSPIWEPVRLICFDRGRKIDCGLIETPGNVSAFLAESASCHHGKTLVFGDITMQGRPRLLIVKPAEMLRKR
ncbi:MAG TPA: hypothetical protein VEJ63_13975 [Planctomycetota bacterium]|nr:hypothetical protein [Planctomycetota bacterium]